jgi:glycosyltransferase involved in cell wall biosynthesis
MLKLLLMISVLVATKNRRPYLEQLLDKISDQILLPLEVIIIDASDKFIKLSDLNYPFRVLHIESSISSTTIQRNIGLDLVDIKSKYVAILDDDTYPDKNYLSEVIKNLIYTDAVGVSGIALPKNPRIQSSFFVRTFKYAFFLDHWDKGRVTKGGINVPILKSNNKLIKTNWLIGCSVYNIKKIPKLRFDSGLYGYALFDDVIFSLQASLEGDLYVDTRIILSHIELSKVDFQDADFWYKWTRNRKKVIELLSGNRSKWLGYYWCNFGQMLIILFKYKAGKFRVFRQMISGMS